MSDCDRDWDEFSQGFFACPDLWAAGGGNSTDHIIPANSMQPELRLSFVRVMRENADLPRIKSEPADGENVKSESSSTSDAKSLSNANKKSSARNSRGGVRESWKVSPTKEDSNSKLNGPTSNSNDSLSNSNISKSSNHSKHNANSTDENSETKVKCEENGLIKDEDSCVDSAVKKGSSPAKKKNSNSTTEDVIQELEARSGLR